jgi:hypothetical protein
VYADLRAAGLPLPTPGSTHVEIPVDGRDGTRLACHIALSSTDLDAFDMTILSDKGLARAERPGNGALASLLRHAVDDIINAPGGRGRDLAARSGTNGQLTNAE